jgi:hypothetical protein
MAPFDNASGIEYASSIGQTGPFEIVSKGKPAHDRHFLDPPKVFYQQ